MITKIFRKYIKRAPTPEQLIQQQTNDCLAHFSTYAETLHHSKKALQKLRNQRLRALLAYAKQYSPWYRASLAKFDIDHFTEEQLAELPTINKTILMNHWDAIVTDRSLSFKTVTAHLEKKNHALDTLYLHNRYHVLATGGTSGQRGIFIYDWEAWNIFYSCMSRYPLYDHKRTRCLSDITKKTRIASMYTANTAVGGYAFATSFAFSWNEFFHFPITLPLQEIVNSLNRTQPKILSAPPSLIHKLCQEAHAQRLMVEPEIIFVGAEALQKPTQILIQETWPMVNLFNIYAASEGIVGLNCHANSDEMHLNEDFCILEPVDAEGNLIKKGIISNRQYLTNLYNYKLPLIRYEMSDQIKFLEKTCECGIHHQLIEAPQGRAEFSFIYPGNVIVSSKSFALPLVLERNIQEYQVLQTQNGADIRILRIGWVDKVQLQQQIYNRLSRAGLLNPVINFIDVSHFDYLPSGKLRRFVKQYSEIC